MKKSVLILMTIAPLTAFGWGQTGHDVVAKIADNHLSDKARTTIHAILGGHDLVFYANWMDNIRNAPNWINGYDATSPWHYANVDEGYTYETMPHNAKGDVIVAINTMTAILKSGQLSDSLRFDYLRMVIHMVGDLHQPLHAGHLSDLGGNRTEVKWFDSKTSLHSVWDTKLMNLGHNWSYTEWVEQIDIISPQKAAEYATGTPREWFEESYQLAVKIYAAPKPSNTATTFAYSYNWIETVETQLLKAGYRLAMLLNNIYG